MRRANVSASDISGRTRCWLLVALLAIVVVVGSIGTHSGRMWLRRFAVVFSHRSAAQTKFSSANWQRGSRIYHQPFIRHLMVQDLTRRYRLVGLNRAQIHRILGKPDYGYQNVQSYFLRPDGGGDAVVLDLDYDTHGRVRSAKVTSN